MTNGAASGLIAAVDIGATFTDSVLVEPDGRVAYGNALSSPGDDFQGGSFGSLKSAATLAGYDPDVDAEIIWRELFCPGCATRLATEVARPDDDVLIDIRLAESA